MRKNNEKRITGVNKTRRFDDEDLLQSLLILLGISRDDEGHIIITIQFSFCNVRDSFHDFTLLSACFCCNDSESDDGFK
jgi:hypothetical protein